MPFWLNPKGSKDLCCKALGAKDYTMYVRLLGSFEP